MILRNIYFWHFTTLCAVSVIFPKLVQCTENRYISKDLPKEEFILPILIDEFIRIITPENWIIDLNTKSESKKYSLETLEHRKENANSIIKTPEVLNDSIPTYKNEVETDENVVQADNDNLNTNEIRKWTLKKNVDPKISMYDTLMNENNAEVPMDVDNRGLTQILHQVYNVLQKYYLPVPKYVDNSDCTKAVNKFFINLNEGLSSWSLKMGDSWGKVPDGFLFGNIHTVGMYEECRLIKGEAGIGSDPLEFTGKYCTVYYKSENFSLGSLFRSGDDLTRSGPALAVLARPLPYYYGTCMPSVCTKNDLETSLQVTLPSIKRELTRVVCQDEMEGRELDGFDITVLTMICVLAFLVLCSSLVDGYRRRFVTGEYSHLSEMEDNAEKHRLWFLDSFSIMRTFHRIFAIAEPRPGEIRCLHGIRVITLIWIITCHQYETAVDFISNTGNAKKYQDPILGQLITNGWPAVDTFFTLSGILVMVRLLPGVINKEESQFIRSLIRRIIRLSPSILFLATFSATLIRFIGFGPRLHLLQRWALGECRQFWWKDPLFIDNYQTGDHQGVSVNDCLGQCWFTAVDMQFFVFLVPLILITFRIGAKYGFGFLSIVTVGSIITPIIITIVNDFPPYPLVPLSPSAHYEYMWKFYLVPWCRAGPWIAGVWCGILIVWKRPKWAPRPHWIAVTAALAGSIIIGLVVVLSVYHYNHLVVLDHVSYTTWEAALYAGFARLAWGIAISCIVLFCHFGRGGPINHFLSWYGWYPLSRLTFLMYLISPIVQMWWSTVLYLPVYFCYTSKLLEICGVYFISFICAVIVSVLVEQPFLALSLGLSSKISIYRKSRREKMEMPTVIPTIPRINTISDE